MGNEELKHTHHVVEVEFAAVREDVSDAIAAGSIAVPPMPTLASKQGTECVDRQAQPSHTQAPLARIAMVTVRRLVCGSMGGLHAGAHWSVAEDLYVHPKGLVIGACALLATVNGRGGGWGHKHVSPPRSRSDCDW